MRHQKNTVKLGRTAEHRKALLANQVCSLIEHSRIKTTLAKAKAVRPFAERMLTLGKRGTLQPYADLGGVVVGDPAVDELAPKQVGAPADKKVSKPAKEEESGDATAKEKAGETKKRVSTGSRRSAGIAKRASAKVRKANASPTPQAKARSRAGAKGSRGGKGR